MRPRRIMFTRGRVTITVTLTLYAWLALNGALTRHAVCGDSTVLPHAQRVGTYFHVQGPTTRPGH
jgi:hypothetical protein